MLINTQKGFINYGEGHYEETREGGVPPIVLLTLKGGSPIISPALKGGHPIFSPRLELMHKYSHSYRGNPLPTFLYIVFLHTFS